MSNDAPETDTAVNPVTLIELANCRLSVGYAPMDTRKRALFIGPLVLQISLDDAAAKVVVEGLTGVKIALPGEIV